MGVLRVLSRHGDDRVAWDTRVATGSATADAEVWAAVAEAERIFRAQQERGATAFRVESGQAPVRIKVFDPTAEQIFMVPRVVGG